ncbi:MAG: hypothetical protein WCJ72_04200 [Chryseobacterium sp.]
MNFKQWFFNELEIATLGKEKIYPSGSLIDPSGSSGVITLGQKRSSEVSGFCLHNPEINAFAQKNSTNMFIVFAFVFYTVQKEWQIVHQTFPDFLKWVFEDAIYKTKKDKPNAWNYADQSFVKYANLLGGKKIKNATYLEKLWAKKDTIYKEIKNLIDKNEITSRFSGSSDFKIFEYIVNNIDGLAAVKGAFATQLIIGKYGCVDSVNMRAYDKMIRDDIKKDPKKSGFSLTTKKSKTKKDALGNFINITDKEGNALNNTKVKSGNVGLKGYVGFLDTLQELYNDSSSKQLWDDWCKIVNDKIIKSNDIGDSNKIKLNVNDQEFPIKPYTVKSNTRKMIDKEKEFLQKVDPTGTGSGVSFAHLQSILTGKKYGEKFDITKVLEKIKILKEYILSQNIL